jgi:CspA family cold shock protein
LPRKNRRMRISILSVSFTALLEVVWVARCKNMAQGTVKWFNQKKGFGFIEQEDGEDLFVHHTQVEGIIEDGDPVEFEVGEGPKGPNAINVSKSE